jgi:hypothetical protein
MMFKPPFPDINWRIEFHLLTSHDECACPIMMKIPKEGDSSKSKCNIYHLILLLESQHHTDGSGSHQANSPAKQIALFLLGYVVLTHLTNRRNHAFVGIVFTTISHTILREGLITVHSVYTLNNPLVNSRGRVFTLWHVQFLSVSDGKKHDSGISACIRF